MKLMLKASGNRRLKLRHDEPVSFFAFKSNLRRYAKAELQMLKEMAGPHTVPPLRATSFTP